MTDRAAEGAVALEVALSLPLVAVILAGLLSTTTVVVDQLEATRAARAAARTVALTGDVGRAATVAGATSPSAIATTRIDRGVAVVTVRVPGDLAGLGYTVEATATAPLEPITAPPAPSH